MDKKTAALLSYLAGWITGVIFLFVGKDDPDVKYHAAQSIVFFGGLSIILVAVSILSNIFYAITGSLAILGAFGLFNWALWIFGFVMWVICLVKASSGNGARFQIPVVGGVVTPFALQISGSV